MSRGTPLEGVHKRKRRGYRADRFISTVERADLDLTDLPALAAAQTRVFRRSRAAIYRSLHAFRRGYVKIRRAASLPGFVTRVPCDRRE